MPFRRQRSRPTKVSPALLHPCTPRFNRSWLLPLLALFTALLCTVSPVWAKDPALNTVLKLSDTSVQTPSLVEQGKLLYEAGQYSDAVKVLQQAVRYYERDYLKQAMTLSDLSLAYQQLGMWPEATKAIANGLSLLKSDRNSSNKDRFQVQAQILNTRGRMQLSLGQPEPALTTWQQATNAYTRAGDPAGVTLSTINQAQALQALGLYRRALATLKEVDQNLQKQPDSLLKVAELRHLGNASRAVGELSDAQENLQQSLALAQKLRSPSETAAALLSLGNVARLQLHPQAALAFYQQAATSPTIKLQAQLNQLNLLLETQQWKAAEALLPQLQSQIASLPPSHNAIYARIDFAQSLMRLSLVSGIKQQITNNKEQTTDIAKLLATAVQQAKSLEDKRAESYALGTLGGLYEQTQQLSIAADLTGQALLKAKEIEAPDIAYRWQWQSGRLLKAKGDIPGAIAAYTEAVSILKSLRNDLVAINPDIQFSFRESVEPVYRQLVNLLLQPEATAKPSQDNLKQAREVIESLQLAELDNFFRSACLSGQTIPLDQVIDKDNSDAAFVYPIILADRLEVILKLPQQQNLRHYTTSVTQSQVESTAEQLRQSLELPYTDPEGKSQSQQMYNWLIRPAEADLAQSQIKTLVFVLDGALRNIPMAALYDGKQYLVEKYSVALTPGLRLLNPKPLKQVKLRTLAAGLSEAHLGFSALSNVAVELNQIKASGPSVVLLNRQFTSTALQKQIESLPFPVVHLATHGQFSSDPDETFILAWDQRIKVNDMSRLLQLRQNQPSAIELLVLSACQTAAGDKRAALGLAGVAVRSGARSTIASLWNINDESGALLLGQFYRELAKTPGTKAEALRRAQLTLLKDPNYRHPVYWASYVLVGNWL